MFNFLVLFSQIFETQSYENDTLNQLLLHLGFTVEKDKEDAQIFFPSSEKESVLKATLGLVDALAGKYTTSKIITSSELICLLSTCIVCNTHDM